MARLSKHGSQWAGEIIPDSEEERQKVSEVIEISSDEETLSGGVSLDDPFLQIPGSWPTNNLNKSGPSDLNLGTPRLAHDPQATSVKATPRKTYRARRIIESSSSEGSDAECKVHADLEIIELSDNSPERPIPNKATPERLRKKERASVTRAEKTLYDAEDASDDDDAILTLNEPRSARKPYHRPDLTQGRPKMPGTIPRTPLQDLLSDSEEPMTLGARRTPVGTPTRRKVLFTLSTPLSTTEGTSKPKQPRTGKKVQAAAELARRQLYAQEMFNELNRVIFKDGLPKDTKLNWSKRLLTTAGKARWHRSRDGIQTTEIELAEKILDCDERIRNTLSHEMCHLASWIIDANPKEGHGRIWKAWATKVMHKRPEIEITTRHDYEISYTYEWKCEKCAKIYGRFSNSIRVDECVCGSCKEGRLTPLFATRAAKIPKTPKTSRMASIKPQDSPRSIPRSPATSRTDSGTNNSGHVYTIHDSDSESDPDIAILTTSMSTVMLAASETS